MLVSIVVRTLNEARHLPDLLAAIAAQETAGLEVETVVVDSGSTDGTLQIAKQGDCKVVYIRREVFSFGRSLNLGCEAARGDILVMISGHCVPTDTQWLRRLCEPVAAGTADYAYGRQVGGPESRFSECRIFEKYYPFRSRVPQQGFFCNNANSALARRAWQAHRFDEDLTGLEDMELAKRLVARGGKVGYVAEACVYHYHLETWAQVRRRFEREAIALQRIMPQIHVRRRDTVRYILSSINHDLRHARGGGKALRCLPEIVRYRFEQYLGSYLGNHEHRKLSHAEKDLYFYPANPLDTYEPTSLPNRGPAADESQ
jgi:rhamnosyltransferase